MGNGRSRRTVGVVVLAAALVLAFLVARGATFPQAGHPLAAWPPSPALGSCQELADSGLVAVPCARSHSVEVTKTWQATDAPPKDLATACWDAAVAYLGPAADPPAMDGWRPDAPRYSAYQWGAPPTEVVGGRGWIVCVIAPWRSGESTGSVRALASAADRPSAFGTCGVTGEPTLIPCDEPHNWEQLGQASADLPSAGDEKAIAGAVSGHASSCRTLAAALIGVTDPTYDDRLQLVVDAQAGFTTTSTATAPAAATTTSPPSTRATEPRPVVTLTCRVLDTRQQLVGSLMGWGNRPLPVK